MSVFDGVKIGTFELHSGGTSQVLFDVPAMLLRSADRKYIQNVLIGRMSSYFNAIVGIEFGGALLAMLLGEWYADKVVGFYRKDGTVVLGWPRQNVVLIDDVRTTGASFAEARAALEAAGHTVVQEIALIDRSTP
jgi:orotate phosphoribosyltransferase